MVWTKTSLGLNFLVSFCLGEWAMEWKGKGRREQWKWIGGVEKSGTRNSCFAGFAVGEGPK